MKQTDARVRYTQRILKEALLTLLREKPINKITVKELCDLAELNRATFYALYSDCFALLESIENELLEAFRRSLAPAKPTNAAGLIEAIYGIIENHRAPCEVLIFGKASPSVLPRMIELARGPSLDAWKRALPKASDEEIEMLYVHLSNGLMHVVVDGYGKFSREAVVKFVENIVSTSLGPCGQTDATEPGAAHSTGKNKNRKPPTRG